MIPLLAESVLTRNNIVKSILVYTEKVNKVRGYVKGKLGKVWKARDRAYRNSSKNGGYETLEKYRF